MSNPIPRRLLKHTAALYPYIIGSNDQFESLISLSHVYTESVKQNAMTSLGDMKNDRFILYFDRVNSVPSGQIFKAKDKIIVDGLVCRIRKAEPKKAATSDDIHHWELSLV